MSRDRAWPNYTPEHIRRLCESADHHQENGWMSSGERCMVALVLGDLKYAPRGYTLLECVDRVGEDLEACKAAQQLDDLAKLVAAARKQ